MNWDWTICSIIISILGLMWNFISNRIIIVKNMREKLYDILEGSLDTINAYCNTIQSITIEDACSLIKSKQHINIQPSSNALFQKYQLSIRIVIDEFSIIFPSNKNIEKLYKVHNAILVLSHNITNKFAKEYRDYCISCLVRNEIISKSLMYEVLQIYSKEVSQPLGECIQFLNKQIRKLNIKDYLLDFLLKPYCYRKEENIK